MENQKSSFAHPLLSSTSRQFYTRRIAPRTNSNVQIEKVLRLLNCSSHQKKQYIKVKTECKEQNGTLLQMQIQNMRKIARIKLQNTMKKEGKQWRQLLDCFQNYSKSSSRQCLFMNETNFILKMEQIIKNIKPSDYSDRFKPKDQLQFRVRDPKVQLQNIKLLKQNQILKQQLLSIQNQSMSKTLSINNSTNHIKTPSALHHMTQEHSNRNILAAQNVSELQREVDALRQTNDMLRQQKKGLQQKINELKISNENLCEEIIKNRMYSSQNKQKFQQWRNIMNMQNQQILSLKYNASQLRQSLVDLNKKYQNMLKRITKLSAKDQTNLSQVTKKTLQIFTEQIQSFQKIRNQFIVKGFYQTISGNGKQPSPSHYKKYLNEKESLCNTQGVKKSSKQYLRYYKPTFFVFLQKYFQYQGVDRQNFQKIELLVGVNFLITLRAILDSKYNEYLLCRKASRQFSSLPTFTLSWLSNFTIDFKTKKQQQITSDVCFQTIGSFYVKLMSHHLNSNWEAITFREFLLQTLTTDELAFYLKARFFLLKGDGIAGRGAFTQIFYINYVDALYIIQLVVSDFDYRKKLEDYIKRSVQFQRKKQLIDAHFVLRLLLQYYQYKKAQTFSIISKTFYAYSKDRNTNMPFESFLKIFDYNSFELSLIDRIQIYQKAFSLGRGIVNLENIFTVLNQEGFLCNQVQKMFIKRSSVQQPIEKQSVEKERQQNQSIVNFQKFIQKQISKQIPKFGIQRTKILLNPSNNKTNSFQTIIQHIDITFQLSLAYLKKLFHAKKLKEDDLYNFVQICTQFFKQMTKFSIQKKTTIDYTEQFLKKNAARQILRFYRRKRLLNRSYIGNIDLGDINDKSQVIRKQFSHMIESLKKKYNSKVPKIASQAQLQD